MCWVNTTWKMLNFVLKRVFSNERQPQTYPEILRSNLAKTVLTLKKLGINDLVHFDILDPPDPETLMRALEVFNYLGALDNEGNLIKLGEINEPIFLGSADVKNACGQCRFQLFQGHPLRNHYAFRVCSASEREQLVRIMTQFSLISIAMLLPQYQEGFASRVLYAGCSS